MRIAVALSEEWIAVIVRMTTPALRIRAGLCSGAGRSRADACVPERPEQGVMMPAFCKGAPRPTCLKLLQASQEQTEINDIQRGRARSVCCAAERAISTPKRRCQADIFKLGMTVPLPKARIRRLPKPWIRSTSSRAGPAIEQQVKSWGIDCIGSGCFQDRRVERGTDSPCHLWRDGGGEPRTGSSAASAGAVRRIPAPRDIPRPQSVESQCLWRYRMLYAGRAGAAQRHGFPICMGASIDGTRCGDGAGPRVFAQERSGHQGQHVFPAGLTGVASASSNQSNITILILDQIPLPA